MGAFLCLCERLLLLLMGLVFILISRAWVVLGVASVALSMSFTCGQRPSRSAEVAGQSHTPFPYAALSVRFKMVYLMAQLYSHRLSEILWKKSPDHYSRGCLSKKSWSLLTIFPYDSCSSAAFPPLWRRRLVLTPHRTHALKFSRTQCFCKRPHQIVPRVFRLYPLHQTMKIRFVSPELVFL